MAENNNRELALAKKKEGNGFFSKGEYEKAIDCFSQAIIFDPSDHVFFSNRSACYASIGQSDKALEDAIECIRLKPTWPKGYSRKGAALSRQGKFTEAKEAYLEGLKIDGNNAMLKSGLEAVEKELQAQSQANPFAKLFGDDIWVKIQMNPKLKPYLDDPQFVQNVKTIQKNPQAFTMLLGDPKIKDLFSALLGIDLQGMGGDDAGGAAGAAESGDEFKGASNEPTVEEAAAPEVKEEPKDERTEEQKEADLLKTQGNDLYKAKKYVQAYELYEKAHKLLPDEAVYLSNMAAALIGDKKYDKAIELCKKAIDLPNTTIQMKAKLWARIGNAESKKDNLSQAIMAYDKSLMEDTNRKVKLKRKKLMEIKKKRDKEAYLDDEKSLHHKNLGNKHFGEGKYKDAIDEYTEAIKRNPKDHKIYSNRSACYAKLMTWGKALEDAETAIKLDPTFVKAYVRKGKVEHFLKKYHKAIKSYEKALELEPGSPEIQKALLDTRMAISRQNSAKEVDPEVQARAMADPDVKRILGDPQMQQVLKAMQEQPQSAARYMADPKIRENIETLVAAGVLKMG